MIKPYRQHIRPTLWFRAGNERKWKEVTTAEENPLQILTLIHNLYMNQNQFWKGETHSANRMVGLVLTFSLTGGFFRPSQTNSMHDFPISILCCPSILWLWKVV